MQSSPLVITNQVLGDNFGFNLVFPYDVNGWEITMTLKKSLTQIDAQADAQAQVTPTGLTPDDNGNETVALALTAAQTAALKATTYYFDITTKDLSGNVEHVISPESCVSFIKTVTQNP